jgi:hypothetical protein
VTSDGNVIRSRRAAASPERGVGQTAAYAFGFAFLAEPDDALKIVMRGADNEDKAAA